MPLKISGYKRARRDHFETVIPSVLQRCNYQRTANSLSGKFLSHFRVNKIDGVTSNTVFQLRDQSSTYYFEAKFLNVVDNLVINTIWHKVAI